MSVLFSHFTSCSSSHVTAQGSKISAEDIMHTIQEGKEVYIENKTVEGTLDFTQLPTANTESNAVIRHYVASSITFKNCEIKGKIICYRPDKEMNHLVAFAKNLSFVGCKFKDEVQVRESIIYGRCMFNTSTFDKVSSFEGSTFMLDVAFGEAEFNEEARFQNCNFQHRSNFMTAMFDKTVSFQGSNFALDAQFSNVNFKGYADMSLINWDSHCFFNYARFWKQGVLSNSYFKGRTEFIATTFDGNTEINHCNFYGVTRMNNAKLNDKMSIDNSFFLLSKPETTGFVKGTNAQLHLAETKVPNNQSLTENDFGQ